MLKKIKLFSLTSILLFPSQGIILTMDQKDQKDSWYNIMQQSWYKQRQLYEHNEKLEQFHFLRNFINNYQKKVSPNFRLLTLLEQKCKNLKEKDNNNKPITHEDIHTIKTIWNKFKSLYNYNVLDAYIYPSHPFVSIEELEKIRKKKPLNLLIYSDKYKTEENKKQMNILFIELGDVSRPEKYYDFIVNPIKDVIEFLAIQTGFLTIGMATTLPSTLFPNHFKSKNTLDFEKGTNTQIKEIKEHGVIIEKYCNDITAYNIAIKTKNLSITKKQEYAKELLKELSKDKIFNN